jgi:DNA gyrase subunit B
MMWETTMNPATRRLIRVSETDADETALMFDTLLGDDLPARKEFITKYGQKYLSDLDLDDD